MDLKTLNLWRQIEAYRLRAGKRTRANSPCPIVPPDNTGNVRSDSRL